MERAVIALGSNVGDRKNQIKSAALKVATLGTDIEYSHFYESRPWGVENQAYFLNAAMSIVTKLTPMELLQELQQIEITLGRKKRRKWGPREIDLDIILYGTQKIDEESLIIPHPYFRERCFVLLPLSELKVGHKLVTPIFKTSISTMISSLDKSGVTRLKERIR